ncbi:MAG: VanZ family protein [Hellea sp.]|nr:VanZ family protein [Hellea sp.]
MALLTSARESQLWMATALVVGGIFATLFLDRPFLEQLGNKNVQAAFFLGGMGLIGLAIMLYAMFSNPGKTNLIILLGIATIYMMLFLRLGLTERGHMIEYSVMALCVHEILFERARNGKALRPILLWAFAISFLIGCIDESLQLFIPDRVFDPVDIVFNAMVIFMALAARGTVQLIEKMRGA